MSDTANSARSRCFSKHKAERDLRDVGGDGQAEDAERITRTGTEREREKTDDS